MVSQLPPCKLLPESKSQWLRWGRAAWPAGGWLCHLVHGQRAAIPGAKLVFLARDMYLVRQVYQLLYPEEETFYLKASRQSLLPALLQCPMNEQALALLADTLPRQQLTQRQIAAYLALIPRRDTPPKPIDLRTRPLPCRTKEMLLALAAHSKLPEGEAAAQTGRASKSVSGTGRPDEWPGAAGGYRQRRNHPACAGRAAAHPAVRLLPCLRCAPAPEPAAGARQTFLFDGCPAPLWYWVGQPMLEVLLSEPCGSTVGYHAQAADGAGNRAGGCR